jgi:hypothetical protein
VRFEEAKKPTSRGGETSRLEFLCAKIRGQEGLELPDREIKIALFLRITAF